MKKSAVAFGFIFFISLIFALFSSASPGKKPVVFRSYVNLFHLDASRSSFQGDIRGQDVETKTLYFKIDPSECFVCSTLEGYDYLKVGNLAPSARPGAPLLPRKTFVVELEKNARVYGVEVIDGMAREVDGEFEIMPAPEPGKWSPGAEGGRHIPDKEIYALSKPFPGKLVSYDTGADNKTRYVFVRFFPVQYTPGKKKAVVVTEATIKLYYAYEPAQPQSEGTMKSSAAVNQIELSGTTQCIIMCPATVDFVSAANSLRDFHISLYGAGASEVVTTQDIIDAQHDPEDPALNPPFPGYKDDTHPGKENITGYDYDLAKQVIAFLRDCTGYSSLKYVVILGDAASFPPSYYYYYEESSYWLNNWVPTDLLYWSPDYYDYVNEVTVVDFIPNFSLGRLSVNDGSEAQQVVDKIKNWYANTSDNPPWFQNVYLAGGDAHNDHYYCAELNLTYEINAGYLDGMDITKCFHTDGTFTKDYIEPALKGASVDTSAGVFYHLGHGSGTAMMIDGRDITTREVLRYAPSSQIPVMLTPSCNNGTFDHELIGGTSRDVSFGEAIIKSPAGAIAYVGGSRLNEGDSWPLEFDYWGNVTFNESADGMPLTYILAIFHHALRNYQYMSEQNSDKVVLGDVVLNALMDYMTNSFSADDENDEETLFRHVFFGDPTLRIPAQQQTLTVYTKPVCTVAQELKYRDNGIPVYGDTRIDTIATNNSPNVIWKLIDVNTDSVLYNYVDNPEPDTTFTDQAILSADSLYLLRTASCEDATGTNSAKENWMFYKVAAGVEEVHYMHVESVVVTTEQKAVFTTGIATVTVLDDSGQPVPEATVTGDWSGAVSGTGSSGVTGSDGIATITSRRIKNAQGTFQFCVTNVEKPGYVYDSGSNVATCDPPQ